MGCLREDPATTDAYTPKGAALVTRPIGGRTSTASGSSTRTRKAADAARPDAEGLECWVALARADFDRVVQLYERHVSRAVRPDDCGCDVISTTTARSSRRNYDVQHLEHGTGRDLSHPRRTCSGPRSTGGAGDGPRQDARGRRISDVRPLISSSGFGNANWSSDPNIGYAVNVTRWARAQAPGPPRSHSQIRSGCT